MWSMPVAFVLTTLRRSFAEDCNCCNDWRNVSSRLLLNRLSTSSSLRFQPLSMCAKPSERRSCNNFDCTLLRPGELSIEHRLRQPCVVSPPLPWPSECADVTAGMQWSLVSIMRDMAPSILSLDSRKQGRMRLFIEPLEIFAHIGVKMPRGFQLKAEISSRCTGPAGAHACSCRFVHPFRNLRAYSYAASQFSRENKLCARKLS
mmetsp:Transcript_4439/g.10845  ORF Transcript_4439/g.10845 Transcript_4439/m.10845 type:complete len:204 (+) Transcript_4439:1338-1949(+)